MSFNNWLAKTREKKGLTLDALAEKSGVSKTTIFMAETTDTDMRLGTAAKISKALGVPLWQALKAAGEMRNGKSRSAGGKPSKSR